MTQHGDHLPILVVEDSDEDFDVLKMTFESLQMPQPILRASDGSSAMKLLEDLRSKDAALPGLIILDLNLIGIDGQEVLRRLKTDPVLQRIPVIILSTSASPKDVDQCYHLGAAAYTIKPVSLEKLEAFATALKAFWLDQAVLPRENHLLKFRRANV